MLKPNELSSEGMRSILRGCEVNWGFIGKRNPKAIRYVDGTIPRKPIYSEFRSSGITVGISKKSKG